MQTFLIVLLAFSLLYLLLWWFVPKKTILHELLRIPLFLFRTVISERNKMIVEKHRFGKHRRQYVLFFQPPDRRTDKKNVIVYYHGGGWRSGSPELLKSNAQFFVKLGYCVFMPSYRRAPFNGYPEIREDLNRNLEKVIEIMKSHQLQDKKIVLGGMSAGGNLAALILYDRSHLEKLGIGQGIFNGIMLFGAPLDLTTMKDTFVLRDFAGRRDQETFRLASPVSHLRGDEKVPVLCVHGTHDGLVPLSSALSFKEKFGKTNGELLTFSQEENASHLDTATWAFENNDIRRRIADWLQKREI